MVVEILKPTLIKYWHKYANDVIPWLVNRPITLEQVFDGKVIYRRYTDKTHANLITVNSVEEILTWAYRHTYSFHPYICSPNQKARCWYVLDIDPSAQVKFSETKSFTNWIASYLQYRGFDIFVTFGGKNGFHIFIELNFKAQHKVFEFSKNLSLDIAIKAWAHKEFPDIAIFLTSKQEQNILENKIKKYSFDNYKKYINLDTRILHKFANIRSPYSIHPETGLASLPVAVDDILHFKLDYAKIENLI